MIVLILPTLQAKRSQSQLINDMISPWEEVPLLMTCADIHGGIVLKTLLSVCMCITNVILVIVHMLQLNGLMGKDSMVDKDCPERMGPAKLEGALTEYLSLQILFKCRHRRALVWRAPCLAPRQCRLIRGTANWALCLLNSEGVSGGKGFRENNW